jgi:peptidoglycan/xylan/chitin deacetylase (PgdA/CDA1 family)
MRRRVGALLAGVVVAAALLTLGTAQAASDRHFAAPLPGASILASFDPQEGWRGGSQLLIPAPWGDSSALLLSATDGGVASADLPVSADLSSNNVRLVFFTGSAAALDEIGLTFDVGGDGSFANTFQTDLTEINVSPGNYTVNNGWNAVAKPKRFDYSPARLPVEALSNVDAIRVSIRARPGMTASVLFVRLELLPLPARGIVTLTFDHVPAIVPQRIAPIVQSHGYQASFFVTPEWVGRTTDRQWASVDELRPYHAAGWDVGLHAWVGHPDFTKLDVGQARSQLLQGAAWLDDQGFSSPRRLWASPEATWNQAVISLAQQYFDACRCADGWSTFPPDDRYLIRAIGVQHNQSADDLLELARTAAEQREWLILNFHYFDEGAYDFSYDSAEFARFLDGLAGVNVDVLSMSRALARLP